MYVSLLKKLQNECKNPSFLHKTTCIQSDCGATKLQCCLFTFTACNYRGLWPSIMKCAPLKSGYNVGCFEHTVSNGSLAKLVKLLRNLFILPQFFTVSSFPILSKNVSNKSYSELNFLQKSQGAHMSIFPRVEPGGSKDCHI